jgi:hypothetical protein
MPIRDPRTEVDPKRAFRGEGEMIEVEEVVLGQEPGWEAEAAEPDWLPETNAARAALAARTRAARRNGGGEPSGPAGGGAP